MIYYTSKAWLSSRNVLDLGAGTGDYILEIAEKFPEKDYLGVDKNQESIAIANTKIKSDRFRKLPVRFETKDIYDIVGEFDFVIARLLLQHINTYPEFLDLINKILKDGGELLLIESVARYQFF